MDIVALISNCFKRNKSREVNILAISEYMFQVSMGSE